MKRQYPYLISSLPELAFDFDAKKFDFSALKQEVKDNVSATDFEFVRQLFYPCDNQNFLNAYLQKAAAFMKKGNYDADTISKNINYDADKNDEHDFEYLPAYMNHFLAVSRQAEGEESDNAEHKIFDRDRETLLQTLFYEAMAKSKNSFIRRWYDYDKNLRNLQAALVARELNVDASNYFVGEDAEAFAKNAAADFGLSDKIEWINQVVQIAETGNALERERKIDLLRWEKIDELSQYHYFDIDAVLAFMAKADIVERWLTLDNATGKQMFRKLLEDLMSTCDTQKVFAKDEEKEISHEETEKQSNA